MSNREKSISKQMIHKSIKNHVGSLISILFFSLTITVLSIINPILYQKVADDFIPEKNVNALIMCIVLVVIVPVISAFISLLKNKIIIGLGKSVSTMLPIPYLKNFFEVIFHSSVNTIR